ncbi:T9SS type A sorting domain-containing protein, partial [bacterium]|nr:T9SS type A sorting domain-containing protein [bacterium]
DKNGNNMAAGIYFYKIQNGGGMETKKMVFLK